MSKKQKKDAAKVVELSEQDQELKSKLEALV